MKMDNSLMCGIDDLLLKPIDITNKEDGVYYYIRFMLSRLQSMLEYKGLPDTIPERNLKLLLQTRGFACIPVDRKILDEKLNGNYYAFWGGLGGKPNEYYMPTICVVANPALSFSASLKINEECVIIPHDSMYQGMLPILRRYASLMVENDISLRMASINSRCQSAISASDDGTKRSAEIFVSDLEAGKMGVIADEGFIESIKFHDGNASKNAHTLTPLIEYQQYLKASLFNDVGLNANYNMKRESINSVEAMMNTDALIPFATDIINTQQTAFDKLNEITGLKVSVELSSAWKERLREYERTNEEIARDSS